jgi:hypothetical protein
VKDVIAILLIISAGGLVCMFVYALAIGFYRAGRSTVIGIRNSFSEAKSYPAQVVGKRTETSGRAAPIGTYYGGYVDTYYFVTFEFKNGARREYEVSGEEFGLAVVGDQGQLTAKGSRYEYFERAG